MGAFGAQVHSQNLKLAKGRFENFGGSGVVGASMVRFAMSALGSGYACPTAFIAHCPRWRIQRTQVNCRIPALTCPEWMGCVRQDSIGLGVHAGQRSLLHQVLMKLAPSWPSWLRRSRGP